MKTIPIGASASGLDIFTTFDGSLFDPPSINFDIFDASGSLAVSSSGYRISVGHYDARNATIPTGFIAGVWAIDWTFTSPVSVSGFLSENFIASSGVEASVSDPAETTLSTLIEMVSLDLFLGTKYTEDQIIIFIQKALNRINRKLALTGTENEFSLDVDTGEISPTINSSIMDLIVLQTECLIVKTNRAIAVGKGISVRDGDSAIDTTSSFGGHRDVVNDICGELEKAINQYLINGVTDAGQVVYYGNSRHTEIVEDSGNVRDHTSPFDT